jgi:hypothetical protein
MKKKELAQQLQQWFIESESKPSGSRWPWERWYTVPDGFFFA